MMTELIKSEAKLLYIHDGSFQAANNLSSMKKEFDVENVNYLDYHSNESLNGVAFTHVIQHLNSKLWARYGTMHHIGWIDNHIEDFFSIENKCMVDEVWSSVVATSVLLYVPNVVDSSIYEKKYNFQEIPGINGTFSFMVSSIDNKEAPIENIVRAFWEEFDPTEPVSLILNTGPNTDKVVEFVKSRINLYNKACYQKIILIDDNLDSNQELAIMQRVDSYINTPGNWDNCAIHHMGFKKSKGALISVNTETSINDIKIRMRRSTHGIKDYDYSPNILGFYNEENFLRQLRILINERNDASVGK